MASEAWPEHTLSKHRATLWKTWPLGCSTSLLVWPLTSVSSVTMHVQGKWSEHLKQDPAAKSIPVNIGKKVGTSVPCRETILGATNGNYPATIHSSSVLILETSDGWLGQTPFLGLISEALLGRPLDGSTSLVCWLTWKTQETCIVVSPLCTCSFPLQGGSQDLWGPVIFNSLHLWTETQTMNLLVRYTGIFAFLVIFCFDQESNSGP